MQLPDEVIAWVQPPQLDEKVEEKRQLEPVPSVVALQLEKAPFVMELQHQVEDYELEP